MVVFYKHLALGILLTTLSINARTDTDNIPLLNVKKRGTDHDAVESSPSKRRSPAKKVETFPEPARTIASIPNANTESLVRMVEGFSDQQVLDYRNKLLSPNKELKTVKSSDSMPEAKKPAAEVIPTYGNQKAHQQEIIAKIKAMSTEELADAMALAKQVNTTNTKNAPSSDRRQ